MRPITWRANALADLTAITERIAEENPPAAR